MHEHDAHLPDQQLAMLCGVSPRTIDYYTHRGLLEPSTWSVGHQRRFDDRAVRRLRLIKELQAERLTLREITERLAASRGPTSTAALTARIRLLEEELDRHSHDLAELARHLDQLASPDARRAVAQVASLALAKSLALAQWLAVVARDAHGAPLG
jgi:DNA-binding transcriptional MerR regulator